jgi:hypothetical protein
MQIIDAFSLTAYTQAEAGEISRPWIDPLYGTIWHLFLPAAVCGRADFVTRGVRY